MKSIEIAMTQSDARPRSARLNQMSRQKMRAQSLPARSRNRLLSTGSELAISPFGKEMLSVHRKAFARRQEMLCISIDRVFLSHSSEGEEMAGKSRRMPSRDDGIRIDLEQRSFYRFSHLAMQINRAVTGAYIHAHGRPANGWKVITVLGRFGPLSASQIHGYTTLETDKITRIVDSFVKNGLAKRQQDPADRRRVIISLTAKGKRINAQIERTIATMEREFLIVLSREERDALYDLLDRLQSRGNDIFDRGRYWGHASKIKKSTTNDQI